MNTNAQKPATVIIRGQFSTGKGSKGHFTGWDAEGTQIIIQKKMMHEVFGIDTQEAWLKENAKAPIMFDIIYETNKEFLLTDLTTGEPLLDDKGEQKKIVQEARATSIFKDRKDFVRARNSSRMQNLEVEKDFEKEVKSSELSDATIARLLSVSPLG